MTDYIAKCQKFRCPECGKAEFSFYYFTTHTLISCNNPHCSMAFGRDYWGFKTTHHADPNFLQKIERGKFNIKEEQKKETKNRGSDESTPKITDYFLEN